MGVQAVQHLLALLSKLEEDQAEAAEARLKMQQTGSGDARDLCRGLHPDLHWLVGDVSEWCTFEDACSSQHGGGPGRRGGKTLVDFDRARVTAKCGAGGFSSFPTAFGTHLLLQERLVTQQRLVRAAYLALEEAQHVESNAQHAGADVGAAATREDDNATLVKGGEGKYNMANSALQCIWAHVTQGGMVHDREAEGNADGEQDARVASSASALACIRRQMIERTASVLQEKAAEAEGVVVVHVRAGEAERVEEVEDEASARRRWEVRRAAEADACKQSQKPFSWVLRLDKVCS